MAKKREKSRHEADAIAGFISHLEATRGIAYQVIGENVVVDPDTGSNYDYQLAKVGSAAPAVAVEVFRLIEDEADLAAQRHRGMLWEAIKREFSAAGLSDLLVSTPDRVSVLPRDQPDYAKALAALAVQRLSEHPAAKEVRLEDGIELRRIDGLGVVGCSSHSAGRWIDGVSIATPPLAKSLSKKDSQLPVSELERVILCVNWAWTVDPDDAVNAIALMDVSGLSNVDLVYFDSGKSHTLVYARSVRDALSGARSAPPVGSVEADLFEKSVGCRLEKDVPGAFELVRSLSKERGIGWIKDRYRREAIVRAAQRKVREGDAAAGLWAVAAAIEDPDPPLFNYPDDPDGAFNYHEQVRRGEDPSTSVGVRAAVCWLIQQLVCREPAGSWHLIESVERLARDENLYVRQNACVPLVEFAVRTRWKVGGEYAMPEAIRSRTKRLAFEMLRANQEYPAVLKWVSHVMAEMPHLSDVEANEALAILVGRVADEGLQSFARLLVFFAALRAGHPEYPGEFDNAQANYLLLEALAGGPPALRRAICFTIYKTVDGEPETAAQLRPYVLALPQVGLEGVVPMHVYGAIEVMIDGADEGLESALAAMVEAEADWATSEAGRFMSLKPIVRVLRKLVVANRWPTVLRVSRAIATAKHTILGGTSELAEMLKTAPGELRPQADALQLGDSQG